MSLFRLAVVLSLGVAVMPSERAQQERLYQQAAYAAYWTATFCDRNAQTCDRAATFWDTFVKKAQFAGQLTYDVATSYSAGDQTGYAPASYAPGASPDPRTLGTLRSGDLEPGWRGVPARQGI